MKILIEDVETLKYFTSEGRWAKNASEAQCYPGTILAMLAAKQAHIGKFNIVAFVTATNQIINLNHGHGKGAARRCILARRPKGPGPR